MNSQLRIAVIYSLPTKLARSRRFIATDEDTRLSAQEICQALESYGCLVAIHPIDEANIDQINHISGDCIFNVIEWDGHDLPLAVKALSILERHGIPFTGAETKNLLLGNDKVLLKNSLREHQLLTPNWQVFTNGSEKVDPSLKFPVIVKPSIEHCSIGLDRNAVVDNVDKLIAVVGSKLTEFKQPIIAEEFIIGREFQITVYEKNGSPEVLPPAEIIFTSKSTSEFLTFASRWDEKHPDYNLSTVKLAQLSPALDNKLIELSKKTFIRLGFRDYSRLDIRLRNSTSYILEANANPGLGDDEDYGMTVSYKAAGFTFADFVFAIVKSALRRNNVSLT